MEHIFFFILPFPLISQPYSMKLQLVKSKHAKAKESVGTTVQLPRWFKAVFSLLGHRSLHSTVYFP